MESHSRVLWLPPAGQPSGIFLFRQTGNLHLTLESQPKIMPAKGASMKRFSILIAL
jgi:hypothetical protein